MELNIIETKFPLEISLIKEHIEKNNLFFFFNYDEITVENKKFFNYLSNLDIKYDIVIRENLNLEAFSKLINSYIDSDVIISSPRLASLLGFILLLHKGLKYESLPYEIEPITIDIILEYLKIEENLKRIKNVETLIDSSQKYNKKCAGI